MQTHPTGICLICSSCSSDQSFAADFLQIPPHDGHPCLKLTVGTINPRIGLSPTSKHPCWAHIKKEIPGFARYLFLFYLFPLGLKPKIIGGISIWVSLANIKTIFLKDFFSTNVNNKTNPPLIPQAVHSK